MTHQVNADQTRTRGRAFDLHPTQIPRHARALRAPENSRSLAACRHLLFKAPTRIPSEKTFANRSARRLEMPESYRKQTTAPLSNRHKFTHSSVRFFFTSKLLGGTG